MAKCRIGHFVESQAHVSGAYCRFGERESVMHEHAIYKDLLSVQFQFV